MIAREEGRSMKKTCLVIKIVTARGTTYGDTAVASNNGDNDFLGQREVFEELCYESG